MDQKEIERQIMTRLTVPLWPTAGRALGLGRNATFQGAQTGEIETVKVGRRRPVGLTITLRSSANYGRGADVFATARRENIRRPRCATPAV